MPKFLLLVVSVSLLFAAFTLNPLVEDSTFFLGGIQVNEPDHDDWVTALHDAGMNTVSVAVYAKQGDWDSDNLWFDETNEGVLHEIRSAKKAGLKVVLIPRVALDHAYSSNQFLWHGMIMPKDLTSLKSWFSKYGVFISKWARIAEEEGVDVFAIGSEMNALSATEPVSTLPDLFEWYLNPKKQAELRKKILLFSDEISSKHLWVRGEDNYDNLELYLRAKERTNRNWAKKVSFSGNENRIAAIDQWRNHLRNSWKALIDATRKSYSGQLTYAANFDNYTEVDFWNKLDFIGINAYFPLRKDGSPLSEQALYSSQQKAWSSVLSDLKKHKAQAGVPDMPVLFTELGYTSRRFSTLEPWGGFGFSVVGPKGEEKLMVWQEQPHAPKERALAVRALREASKQVPVNLSGILYWKLSTVESHTEIEPFVMHLSASPKDPMQQELSAFLD